ncbi:aldo/keto reductase [Mucilaginibacter ginsenosidivorans]|uniref:Aldo/keto reductase n=1 Tax=Mucilaginibacter ginsenosidivorans TaxID=398053 RepID=A0A5B8UR30_9SPHI|nr:aldo/keto reductase [Mucilaginibacter ginsenosidivorans]QEC61567.1 aldo/keto reductase [Mucilaginibacter ginsenosidivorans]
MEGYQKPGSKGLEKEPLNLPPVIFGTSGLGNLFVALDEDEKLNIVSECVRLSNGKVIFDSAGKYGAGLALKSLGECLRKLNIPQEKVVISNKLGWLRTELKTAEPTFEPGVWKNLKHDAIQNISYDGIIDCFEQGNELLGGYIPQMVSVHDPDEYINNAKDHHHAEKLYNDVLEAYDALHDLKAHGEVQSIGLGAKDWKIIRRIAGDIQLDWIMIANSMTIKSHPKELLDFIVEMEASGVYVINSAVFQSGFLVGSNYYDYRLIERGSSQNDALYKWRDHFFEKCNKFNVKPSEACVQFALNVPGVKSIALNTTNAARVQSNLGMLNANIPLEFWQELKINDLIEVDFVSWLRHETTTQD